MKRFLYVIMFAFVFLLSPQLVEAKVDYTFPEGNYHVVYIKDNGVTTPCNDVAIVDYNSSNIEYVKSFDVYADALSYVNTLTSAANKVASIIGDRKNTDGVYEKKILYSQYALVDLNTANTDQLTSLVYTSATNNTVYTYLNGNGAFGGVDAAFIDYNIGTSKAKMKISGVTGWINSLLNGGNNNGFEIVPISMIKNPSYYYVDKNGNLVHRLVGKITATTSCGASYINLGPAPSSLKNKDNDGNDITYYSYDGNYFYTSLIDMLTDYKNGTFDKSINIIPYYNYYLYSPIRTFTNISADTIKRFLEAYGYTSKEKSALYGEELTFLDAQSKYGVNAAISYATAVNESGWGTSWLAKNKNNLFGHNAYDSSVMTSANSYNSVADGIYRHAYRYINTLFAETKDYSGNYYGSHLGNKNSGINVKYASDAYWGEKIAAVYRALDDFSDFQDLNSNTIGIKVSEVDAPVKSEPKNSSNTLYTLKSYKLSVTNMPVLILDKVEGESINGNNIWYKIQTDALLNDTRDDVIQVSTVDNYYYKDKNYGYIHSSYITLRDENVREIYIRKDGLFGLKELSINEDKTVKITGYLAIKGINNDKSVSAKYDLILHNQNTDKEYIKSLDRITDTSKMPYTIPSVDEYSNEYSWFTGNVDLSDVEEGDYTLYIRARSGQYESIEILSNMLSSNIASKFTNGNRGYQFRTNYDLKTVPVELFIRNNGLISNAVAPTQDNMFNQYQDIKFDNNKLSIKGSSFNVGGNYSTSSEVTRKVILENISTFERYEYDLGYIDNGDYLITLIVPDNFDKTRAWFNNSIDVSNLEKGTYAIYIKTTTNIDDYGELRDIFARSIDSTMTIDDKIYSLSVNQNKRFRLELSVK